ncbi:MAG: MFS transporter [Gammaproteobacteria bacterium]|nr:MFS transporter [Gammaproteobacteria bacterium]
MNAATTIWGPLRRPLFRSMLIAVTVSNIGTWMHDLAAGWLMTTLADSHLMVALVQTATALPFFLIAFPAGTFADIVDRRQVLLFTNVWMLACAAALGLVTLGGHTTPWMLLGLTFTLGVGNAVMRPAWGACIPEFVPREDLRNAVTLNSTSMNASRAVGPVLAGLLVAASGPGTVFLLNAATYLVFIGALWRWRPAREARSTLPVERFVEAMRAGLRYARHTPALVTVLVRGFLFFGFASASWALLPVIALRLLAGGPQTYGLLVGSIGVGAVTGAMLLPRLHQQLSRDALLTLATVTFAATLAALALVRDLYVLSAAMALSGVAWILTFSSLVVAAQLSVPNWVRARGLSLVMLMFGGSSALGSAIWGRLSDRYDIATALGVAAAGLLATLAVARRFRVPDDDFLDLTPSITFPAPAVSGPIEPDRGPVLVTIEYRVPAQRRAEFDALLAESRRIRRRDGAFFWEMFADVEAPEHYVEVFMADSWLEHLRQHERATVSDRAYLDRLREFHAREGPPAVRHLVASHARHGVVLGVE